MSRAPRFCLWQILLTISGPACIGGQQQQPQPQQECIDYENRCYRWAYEGKCGKDDFMRQYCPMSCNFCSREVCSASGTCSAFDRKDESGAFVVAFWNQLQSGSFHIEFVNPQGEGVRLGTVAAGSQSPMTTYPDHIFQIRDADSEKVIGKFRMYTGHSGVVVDSAFLAIAANCTDRIEDPTKSRCEEMARGGHCQAAPGYMVQNCAKTCSVCHLQTYQMRCQRRSLNMTQTPSLQSGDVDAMFEGLQERWPQYNPTVISKSPWIVTFENFISDEEIEDLKEHMPAFERSADTGQRDEFGKLSHIISQHRTSTTSWCGGACETSKGFLAVRERIGKVIKVPPENHENLQFLNYSTDQYYKLHHDTLEEDHILASGPRIYTFFLYFSDVEEGGETEFPEVGVVVKPRKGLALLWPHVLNDNPSVKDNRTHHQALPVKRGVKIAANAFVRLFDYKAPGIWGCVGA